jgi:hypothetical protein
VDKFSANKRARVLNPAANKFGFIGASRIDHVHFLVYNWQE